MVKTVQAIINGQTYNLTLNQDTGKYEATISAPANSSYPLEGHYYPVTVKAVDDAGNIAQKDHTDSVLGESLKLKVKEKVAPTIVITYPTASAVITNNKPTITFKVTDDDSGVNPATIGVTVDSGNKITGDKIVKSKVSGGYECTFVPDTALNDGQHTIRVDASDFDGNAATQKSVAFKVDTVPPTLNITSPSEGIITNNASLTVSGKTNDATSSPVRHEQNIMNIDNSKIKGAYAVAIMSDGSKLLEVMNIKQIKQSWQQGYGYKEKGGTHEKFADQMAKKTVINRLCKMITNTYGDEAVIDTFERLEEADGEDRIAADVAYEISQNANKEEFIVEEPAQIEEKTPAPTTAEITKILEKEPVQVEKNEKTLPDFMKAE